MGINKYIRTYIVIKLRLSLSIFALVLFSSNSSVFIFNVFCYYFCLFLCVCVFPYLFSFVDILWFLLLLLYNAIGSCKFTQLLMVRSFVSIYRNRETFVIFLWFRLSTCSCMCVLCVCVCVSGSLLAYAKIHTCKYICSIDDDIHMRYINRHTVNSRLCKSKQNLSKNQNCRKKKQKKLKLR